MRVSDPRCGLEALTGRGAGPATDHAAPIADPGARLRDRAFGGPRTEDSR